MLSRRFSIGGALLLGAGAVLLIASARSRERQGRQCAAGRDVNGPRSVGSWASRLSVGSAASLASVGSFASILSVASSASILSVGSHASILSVGSHGSILSFGSHASILAIGSARGRPSFRHARRRAIPSGTRPPR